MPGLVGLASDDDLPPLPRSLQLRPVVTLSADLRPRGVRLALGPKQLVLPPESYEHLLSILAGLPDPDNTELDFILHDSATSEACRLRASVGRMRDRIEEAFAGEADAALARNVVVTIEREKTYVLHPGLRVELHPSVKSLPPSVVRGVLVAKLFGKLLPDQE